jgi:hypothetical protein
MTDEFTGAATPLVDTDYEDAARAIGCTVAAVRAVALVESRGGFLPDGRPKILFERHKFHSFTSGKYSAANPDISASRYGGYKGGAAEYDRLKKAIALDREAALKSASWGAFQVMGFNHKLVGFASVEDFVKAMVSGERAHLDAFVQFIKKNHLDDELIRLDWAGFARGYNGPDYARNKYDQKMADAFSFYSHGGPHTESPRPLLRQGDKGDDVRTLQEALEIKVDGDFGPNTKKAVMKFQTKAGLYVDGIVGMQTWAALLDE